MAPKRDKATGLTQQRRGRHQQLEIAPSRGISTLKTLTVKLKCSSACSSTCSCHSIKNVAAAERDRPGGTMVGGFEEVIQVLSSLGAVLIEGQHSCEAQREAMGLFDRCELWP
jgi:hypothetical protein